MDIDLITVKDLKEFKSELIRELMALLIEDRSLDRKDWIKGCEVKKLLNISESKLQKLRIQGMLPSAKIGGVHYYKQSEIEKMFKSHVR